MPSASFRANLPFEMDSKIQRAKDIICREADVVRGVAERLGDEFVRVADMLLALEGRLVTAGMGKAGQPELSARIEMSTRRGSCWRAECMFDLRDRVGSSGRYFPTTPSAALLKMMPTGFFLRSTTIAWL